MLLGAFQAQAQCQHLLCVVNLMMQRGGRNAAEGPGGSVRASEGSCEAKTIRRRSFFQQHSLCRDRILEKGEDKKRVEDKRRREVRGREREKEDEGVVASSTFFDAPLFSSYGVGGRWTSLKWTRGSSSRTRTSSASICLPVCRTCETSGCHGRLLVSLASRADVLAANLRPSPRRR